MSTHVAIATYVLMWSSSVVMFAARDPESNPESDLESDHNIFATLALFLYFLLATIEL